MPKINVYGTGVNAINFVLSNRDLEIASFIEGKNRSKKNFMSGAFNTEVPVIMVEDAEDILEQYYTVIASSVNAYWEIKSRLEEYGLTEFEDFEYFETYHKKIAIAYGNCHIGAVKSALKCSDKFNSMYGFYPLKLVQEIKADGGCETEVWQRCDLFIHQCIWVKNAYGEQYASDNFLRKLSSNCKVIGIPNLYRMPKFMFPQTVLCEESVKWENLSYFSYRDSYIDNNFTKMNIDELCDMVQDEQLISASEIRTNYDAFLEKLMMREKEWDIKISDFLKSKISEVQLFYDVAHPTNIVIEYIVYEILKIMGIDKFHLDIHSIHPMNSLEIPVYKSVSLALGFSWSTDILRKCSPNRLNSSQMDLKEYIRQYLAWNFLQEI